LGSGKVAVAGERTLLDLGRMAILKQQRRKRELFGRGCDYDSIRLECIRRQARYCRVEVEPKMVCVGFNGFAGTATRGEGTARCTCVRRASLLYRICSK
jgi:hypothetical protein